MRKIRFFLKLFKKKKNREVSINLEFKKNKYILLKSSYSDTKNLVLNKFKNDIFFGKKKIYFFPREIIRDIKTDDIKTITGFIPKKKKIVNIPINYINISDCLLFKKKKFNIYINIRSIKVLIIGKPIAKNIEIDFKKIKKRIKVKDVKIPKGFSIVDKYKNNFLFSLKKKRK
ncbi:hypothetical protein ACWNX6_00130 [Candidatus Vidania fulgoroideorum]